MGKIFLGGGGSDKDSYESHKLFYESLGTNKKVLYVPVAMNPNKYSWTDCMNWLNSALKEFGSVEINLLTMLKGLSADFILQYDGIYVGGGNTFKLLQLINESGFGSLLKVFLESGGVYYGGSAGAIIMGKTIDTASHLDENEVELKDYAGLNLANGFSLWPHFKKDEQSAIKVWRKMNTPVIGVGEDSAVMFKEGKCMAIGTNVVNFD